MGPMPSAFLQLRGWRNPSGHRLLRAGGSRLDLHFEPWQLLVDLEVTAENFPDAFLAKDHNARMTVSIRSMVVFTVRRCPSDLIPRLRGHRVHTRSVGLYLRTLSRSRRQLVHGDRRPLATRFAGAKAMVCRSAGDTGRGGVAPPERLDGRKGPLIPPRHSPGADGPTFGRRCAGDRVDGRGHVCCGHQLPWGTH